MLFKDHANRKSNQKNLGTIKSSNLCTEIMEYTSKDEVAVCNLASLALPKFVKTNERGFQEFDHQALYKVTKVAAKNLNKSSTVTIIQLKKQDVQTCVTARLV